MINDWKLDVGSLARAVFAQRYFVILGTAIITLLGVGVLSMKEDQYSASAMILVDDRGLTFPRPRRLSKTAPPIPSHC